MLGALLLSDKPGQPPVWSGIAMNVSEAAEIDPTGAAGPTALQVTGGLFSALQYVLAHPEAGDCFPEDVPTEFVYSRAFPWAGAPAVFAAPQALDVAGFFDPASPRALEAILHGEPAAGRTRVGASPLHGSGTFAVEALPAASALLQLSVDGGSAPALGAAPFNHAPSGAANAYVDRNRAIRTLAPVAAGAEITLDYNLLYGAAEGGVKFVASAATPDGEAPVSNWAAVPQPQLEALLKAAPIEAWLEAEIMANTKLTTVSSGAPIAAAKA